MISKYVFFQTAWNKAFYQVVILLAFCLVLSYISFFQHRQIFMREKICHERSRRRENIFRCDSISQQLTLSVRGCSHITPLKFVLHLPSFVSLLFVVQGGGAAPLGGDRTTLASPFAKIPCQKEREVLVGGRALWDRDLTLLSFSERIWLFPRFS